MVFQVCSNFHPGVELFRPDISNLAVHIKWGGSQWDNDRSSRPSQGRDEMRNNYLTEVINFSTLDATCGLDLSHSLNRTRASDSPCQEHLQLCSIKL